MPASRAATGSALLVFALSILAFVASPIPWAEVFIRADASVRGAMVLESLLLVGPPAVALWWSRADGRREAAASLLAAFGAVRLAGLGNTVLSSVVVGRPVGVLIMLSAAAAVLVGAAAIRGAYGPLAALESPRVRRPWLVASMVAVAVLLTVDLVGNPDIGEVALIHHVSVALSAMPAALLALLAWHVASEQASRVSLWMLVLYVAVLVARVATGLITGVPGNALFAYWVLVAALGALATRAAWLTFRR